MTKYEIKHYELTGLGKNPLYLWVEGKENLKRFEKLFASNKKIKLREIKPEEHLEKGLYSIEEELLLSGSHGVRGFCS